MTGFARYERSGGLPPITASVRPATLGDVEQILRIESRSERAGGTADGYRRAVTDPDRCLLVAECPDDDGPPVIAGWAKTHHQIEVVDAAPTGHYLGGITVDPAWRRRGVAVALTDARMRWIAARADEAFYVVNVRNGASIDLHRRWGFEEILRAPRLIGADFDGGIGLLMRARLGAPAVPR